MRKLVLLIGTIIATVALAQNRRDATAPQPAPHGSATLIRTPAFSPSSLDQLTGKAELILDGEVEAVVPTRLANPNNPTSLETDSIISVNRALKGVTVQRVVVSQPGGKQGDLEIISNQDALMQKGERFILFLTRDNRANLPVIEGLPRFVITG